MVALVSEREENVTGRDFIEADSDV